MRVSEIHTQIADRLPDFKIVIVAENIVLQELQSRKIGVFRKIPGGAGISHYGPNEYFVEGYINVSAQSLTFK
jgi:hypothetical protein